MKPFPIEEGHVDWLTGTCLYHRQPSQDAIEGMEGEAMRVIENSRLAGNKVERATVLGFEGLKSNGVFYGRSSQGFMVRLSGHVAATEWSSFYPFLSNVTRIDCAVTVRTEPAETNLALVHRKEALEYQRKTAPKFKVVHINGHKHGSSLLLGSRASESYARIYDKGLESGLPCYRSCWRYEVEFKKSEATDVAHTIALSPLDPGVVIGIVASWFRKRRMQPAFVASDITRTRIHRQVTDVERQLIWLSTQVGPTVRDLIEQGYAKQVERALFGSQATQPTRADDAWRRTRQARETEIQAKWEHE